MRFLADENFPAAAVAALVRSGVDVEWSLRSMPGAKDEGVLARALTSGAVLLTFDKDFGELARGSAPTSGFGVILFRIPMPGAADAGAALAAIIQSRDDWEGHFSVVEAKRVRMRALSTTR